MRHRKLNRLNGFDYSKDNTYFITSCVQNKYPLLGKIIGEEMQLNELGKIIERQWYWLEEQYSYVKLHAFVVMPDHIHGLIEIDRNLKIEENQKIKSISQLIGAFKTNSSKEIHLKWDESFAWQRSFHDRIVRDENEYQRIFKYIVENPIKWAQNIQENM
ncbi:transposase [Fluviicola taffensis]|uniref:Transposase IS200-like domain-containing protein n=1 Tax=Fluviicola taffensis (strain DSM 16823 / NCIMB 13979 / RW262) TaxID=755732 RepID=F2IGY6_FLUTR|nr:transposase [Fluviicola taffensis]AEA44767.1 hypothetical protein Fluta_2787 [Fluviicola taffensis DSM 16823]